MFTREENPVNVIELRGIGPSLPNVLTLAELIKHRFEGLHQLNEVSMNEFVDEFEPVEEGLDVVKIVKNQPMIKITLSKNQLDKKLLGY